MLFYMNKNDIAGKYGEKATFITNKLFLAIANSGGKLVSYGSKNKGGSRVLPGPIPPIVSPGSHKVGWIFNVPNISNIPIREIDKSCKTGFILRLQTHPIRFVWRFRIIAFILKLRSGRIRYRFLLWIVILYLKDYDSFFCESANIWNDFVFWISILSRFCFSAIHAQVWDYDWNWHSVSAQAATSSPPQESSKIFLISKWLLTLCKKHNLD